jgi:hypothetical protein
MENQYPFLRLALILGKVLAYLSAVLGVAGAVIILFGKTAGSGKLASIGILVSGLVYFLALYLLSDLIHLLLDLDQRLAKIESAAPSAKREIH